MAINILFGNKNKENLFSSYFSFVDNSNSTFYKKTGILYVFYYKVAAEI